MIPTKIEKTASSEELQKLSKSKRRRLRKKKLVEAPQEDGGEAQAELTAEAEIEIRPLVETLETSLPLTVPKPQIISTNSVQERTLYHTVTFTAISQTEITVSPKKSKNKKEIKSEKNIILPEDQREEKAEIVDASDLIINSEMADKDKSKLPQKPPTAKSPSGKQQSQPRSPKVSLSKDVSSGKSVQLPTGGQTLSSDCAPVAVQAIEKSREEIMAERKAKKAEKATKKGKVGKENATPSQEVKPQAAVAKDTVAPKTDVVTSRTEAVSKPVAEVSSVKTEEKSKAALKEERRLKQEAQRAAKVAATKSQESAPKEKTVSRKEAPTDGKSLVKSKSSSKKETHLAKLFGHLQRRSDPNLNEQNIHPAIIKLGLQYSRQQVAGSNARAVALMRAMKQVVEDYKTPPQSELRRDLETRMQTYVEYLDQCRPISVSMINAMRDLKNKLQQLPLSLSDNEAKKVLTAAIDGHGKEDGFIDKIDLDCRSVSFNVLDKIKDGDVILTYGCSSLVQRVLLEVFNEGRNFRVVVVGARPWREAEKMLCELRARGLRCSYLLISAITSVMKEVNKVLLGAHAIYANGYVKSRAGSSQVALIAHSFNVPVIVCCETYKFCDGIQTDAFISNELGGPEELVPGLQMTNLTQCVLVYDVTPPELVSAVVTEVSMIPCSTVPVVLHMQSSETRLKRRSTETPSKA